MGDDEKRDYQFHDSTLTPGVFAVLIQELFGGKNKVQRKELIATIPAHHLRNGGAQSTSPPQQVCKKALAMLESKGLAAKVPGPPGNWKIAGIDGEPVTQDAGDLEPDEDEDSDDEAAPDSDDIALESQHCIYVFDLPNYEVSAKAHGRDRWPHKIGFSRISAEARIAEQVGTALPERPRLVFSYRHVRAKDLETAIHATLRLRGQKTDSPGTEWFDTNPAEVTELIRYLLGEQG